MLRVLCLTALLGCAIGDQIVGVWVNELLDQTVRGLVSQIKAKGEDTIHIENMRSDWQYQWLLIQLSVHSNCSDGYVKSFASLRRSGDAAMTRDGKRVFIRFSLRLGQLEFGFNTCRVTAGHLPHGRPLISFTRHMSASVDYNVIGGQVRLVKNGTQCSVHFDNIRLGKFGKIHIHTGGGFGHKIEDKLFSKLAGHFINDIKRKLNTALFKVVRDNIDQAYLCHKVFMI